MGELAPQVLKHIVFPKLCPEVYGEQQRGDLSWGGKGRGHPRLKTEGRVCYSLSVCGCHRQDIAEKERYRGGEGKKNQTKKTDQKVYPEPTPDKDSPGAAGYSVPQVKDGRRSGWLPT